jgi:hypothetical protein
VRFRGRRGSGCTGPEAIGNCLAVQLRIAIPFSTHAVFLLWCHLQYTSAGYYNVLEQELQAFGLLPQGKADIVSVDQTITATMLRSLAKSLPSAVGDDT